MIAALWIYSMLGVLLVFVASIPIHNGIILVDLNGSWRHCEKNNAQVSTQNHSKYKKKAKVKKAICKISSLTIKLKTTYAMIAMSPALSSTLPYSQYPISVSYRYRVSYQCLFRKNPTTRTSSILRVDSYQYPQSLTVMFSNLRSTDWSSSVITVVTIIASATQFLDSFGEGSGFPFLFDVPNMGIVIDSFSTRKIGLSSPTPMRSINLRGKGTSKIDPRIMVIG